MPTTINPPLPIVSIIIRTQNRCTLLSEALQSLVAQTYSQIAVIIVNDGGENCEEVLKKFQSQLKIQLISLPKPQGRSHAANLGLQAVKGKYINFLDDDDILYPDHIEKLVTFLELTGKKIAYTDCEAGHYHFISGEGFTLQKEKKLFKGFDFDQNQLYFENFLPIMTVMFQHDIALIDGGFDESLEVFEDWDYWIRLSNISDFQRVPGITCEYRFFSNYNYDFQHWRNAIYHKHAEFWTIERLNETAWQRINQLELAELHLQNILNQSRKRLQGLSKTIEDLNVTIRTQAKHLDNLGQIETTVHETQERYEQVRSQLNAEEIQNTLLETQNDQLRLQLQELETQNDLLTLQLQEHVEQMQQLKLHNHHMEHSVNEPGCIIGLYRSLLPLSIRLRLHNFRKAIEIRG